MNLVQSVVFFAFLVLSGFSPEAKSSEEARNCPFDQNLEIHSTRLELKSKSLYRKTFTGQHFNTPSSSCQILYLHGGTCVTEPEENSPHSPLSPIAPGEFVRFLIRSSGCSVLVLNYNENFNWKTYLKNKETGKSREYYDNFEKIRAQECEAATRTVLEDIEDLVRDLPSYNPRMKGKPLHIIGHSYGAYLANLLATAPVADKVASFVSYAGAWDIKKDIKTYKMLNITYSEKINPIERNPKKLGKILVLHSSDDSEVPVSQVESFRSWSIGAEKGKAEIRVLPEGGHYFECVHYPGLFQEMTESILSFLRRNTLSSSVSNTMGTEAAKSTVSTNQSSGDNLSDKSGTGTPAR